MLRPAVAWALLLLVLGSAHGESHAPGCESVANGSGAPRDGRDALGMLASDLLLKY